MAVELCLETGRKMTTETTSTTSTTTGIALTDVAAAKVAALLAQEGRDDLNLRVAVQPGGCSGLKYQLYFDDRNMDGDVVREFGAVKVITDKMSDPYLSISLTLSRSKVSQLIIPMHKVLVLAAIHSTNFYFFTP